MRSYFISRDRDLQEPFAEGKMFDILDKAEAMHPGIQFDKTSPDSDEELEGVVLTADVPNGTGTIIIVDDSYRA